jgi:Tol biopolymer transport system component
MLVPERGNSSVELAELGGEDDVMSSGQTVQESGALLAGTLDLGTDFSKCSHMTGKRRTVIGHSLLLSLVMLAGCGGSEKRMEIAYGVVRDEVPTRIVVVEDDGTDSRRVTGAKRGESPTLPVWSPDGTRIAFVRYRAAGGPGAVQVYVVNADGSGERLVGEGTLPRWTNDGRSLVVERPFAPPRAPTLHVLSVDGNGERLLTRGSAPALSHDGSTVAFVRYAYRRSANQFVRAGSSLHTISLAGTGLRRLDQITGLGTGYVQPNWLPDDSAIAVIERRGDLAAPPDPLVTVSPSGQRRVIIPNVGETYDWSPLGDLIAYTRDSILYVVQPDGTEVEAFGESNAIDIEWSPDGRKVAFTMMEPIENAQFVGLYVIDLDKNERRRIALAEGFVAYLNWRPEPEESDS